MKKILLLGVCACLPFLSVSSANAQKSASKKVDTIDKIKKTNEIIVAVREDQFPFSYLDVSGNARGYTVELCENIIKDIRKSLDIEKLKVVYFPVKEEELHQLFRKNLIDVDCGNTPVVNNESNRSFSNGILSVEARILASHTSTARSLSDFNNQVVAVLKGSSLESLMMQYLKDGTYFYRLKAVNSIDDGIQAIENGSAKGFVSDDVVLISLLASDSKLNESFKITGFPISSRNYAFVLPNGDVKFKNLVNNKLKSRLDSGDIHRIYEKWFLMPIPPYNINLDFGMSKSTRELLNNMK